MKLEISVRNAQEALEYLERIHRAGLVNDQDFTWHFMPNQYDGWDADTQTQPTAVFDFVDEGMATFFKLQWQ